MKHRDLSIRAALEWAFADERARLEWDEIEQVRPGKSTCAVIMERGIMGTEIDGGGISLPHHDADSIASQVAQLPGAYGGRGMAAQIAALARARMAPDFMGNERPRCVARDTRWSAALGDWVAKDEVLDIIETRDRRGRKTKREVRWTPITFRPTAQQIDSARRNYGDWIDALIWVKSALRVTGVLDRITLTDELPPRRPWKVNARHRADAGVAPQPLDARRRVD